jgi:mycarose O-acyltransferase
MPVVDVSVWQLWSVELFPPVRALEFVLGIVLARIVITGRRLPLSVGGALALAVAAYALTPLFPGQYRVAATMVLPLGLVITAAAKVDEAHQKSWLSSRTMVWLGEISFAVYMVHLLVVTYGLRLLGSPTMLATPVALGVLALLLVSVIVVAGLLYTLVERPIMRSLANPRRRPAAALAAVRTGPSTASPTGSDSDRLAS